MILHLLMYHVLRLFLNLLFCIYHLRVLSFDHFNFLVPVLDLFILIFEVKLFLIFNRGILDFLILYLELFIFQFIHLLRFLFMV